MATNKVYSLTYLLTYLWYTLGPESVCASVYRHIHCPNVSYQHLLSQK